MLRVTIAAVALLWANLASAQEDGLALWGQIHEVLSHPRCSNCHVGDSSVPIWSGPSYGDQPRPHGMKIIAGESRIGAEYVPCSTCHGLRNSDAPHGPPGAAATWMLPPADFATFGKTSAEICSQFKDQDRNGGRNINDLAAHIDHDALLQWAWAPGGEREPAPYSKDELTAFILAWGAAGAPCPAS